MVSADFNEVFNEIVLSRTKKLMSNFNFLSYHLVSFANKILRCRSVSGTLSHLIIYSKEPSLKGKAKCS